MRRTLHPLMPCVLALAAPATAQTLKLDKTGGAIGGVIAAHVQGQPVEPYIILFDFIEQQTVIPALGITLEITDTWVGASFVLPGFCGMNRFLWVRGSHWSVSMILSQASPIWPRRRAGLEMKN